MDSKTGVFAMRMAAVAVLTAAVSMALVPAATAEPPKKPAAPAHAPPPPPKPQVRQFNTQSHPVQQFNTHAHVQQFNTQSHPVQQFNNQPHTVQQLHVTKPVTVPQPNALPNQPVNAPQQGLRAFTPNRGPNSPAPGPAAGNALKLGPGKPIFTPVNAGLRPGPQGLQPIKPAFPVVTINNRFFPIVKGPKFIFLGGARRFFVPIGGLGVVLIGGSYWYPDGYVAIDRPYCAGLTPDGCSLHWRMVDFVDGGGEPQCVQYCPQVGPPPVQIATLPPPPPLPQGGQCQLTIFSDPSFNGTSAPTADNQPKLSQTGWRNEISSLQVQSGTWDFFTDEDFGGVAMRLTPGRTRCWLRTSTRRSDRSCARREAPGSNRPLKKASKWHGAVSG